MSLFNELKRRNVFRVGAAYSAMAWLLIQIAETTFPAFGLRDAALRIVIIALSAGLVPAVILAWAFELTPEGLKRDSEVDRASSAARRMTKRLDRIAVLALAVALGYFAFDKFVLSPHRQAAEIATVAEEARLEGRAEAIVESYGDKSIAVMPFTDLSPAGDNQYFSDGISEELLNLLARVPALRVISRSSSFALRDRGLSTPEIAGKLGVSYVLEGSVRRAGNRIRVTAQLIEARSDTHLWSDTYDRDVVDVFGIQEQISARVVSELKVRLLGPPPAAQSTSPTAYDLYLKGLALLSGPDGTDPQEAVAIFEQVAETVPDYAPAHASLALALIASTFQPAPAEQLRIEATANRALALDPDNSDALAALGRVQWFRREVEEAKATLNRARESNPSSAIAIRWLGSTYIDRDPVRYLALVQQAERTNPLYPGNSQILAYAYVRLGDYEEALAQARKTSDYATAEWIHLASGRQDLGLKSLYCEFRRDPDTGVYGGIAWRLIDMGEYDLAAGWIREIEHRQGSASAAQKAVLAHERHHPEHATEILVDARRRGDLSDQDFAFWTLRLARDYAAAKAAYERAFVSMHRDIMVFDPDINWLWYLDYALILQHDSETDRAAKLLDQIQPFIEKQIADGVILGSFQQVQLHLAELHAIRGHNEQAIAALRHAFEDGFTTFPYLRAAPQFDSLREDPAFRAAYAEIEATLMAQRRHLADEDMLLTPEELLKLDNFSFDAFTAD
jgi:TolB-like protein/tetratricopeptide (TPR) repeat protein